MRAVKPKILRNMDEETQTAVGAEVKPKAPRVKGEKDIDTREVLTGADHVAIDKHNVMHCDKHPDKKIEYYCRIHGELPCSRCAIENHRKCQGMSIIEDIASLPRTQKDVYRVSEKIEDAAFQIETQRQMDKRVLSNLDESVERINVELKHYKDKMYKITDSIENRLKKRTDKLYRDRNKTVNGHLDLLNDTGSKVEKLKEAMEMLQATENDAERFVILQKVKKAFTALSTPIHNLHRDAIDVQLNLRLNIDLDKTLEHIDKKMTVEVKTMRRGEQISRDRNIPEIKKKGRKAEVDAISTARSTKSTGRKEGPHKFLAQRNFKPYKIPPYTVEKKQPPIIRGSLTSVKKGKPLIVISGEHIGSQAMSKRRAAAMFNSIESIPEKEDLEMMDEKVNKDRLKVEKRGQNKQVPEQSKAIRYTWGNYSNTVTVGESKQVKSSGTEPMANKTSQNVRYNKSVFQRFDRNSSKEETKDQQSHGYKKSGVSSQTNPGLYRNYEMSERQKQKQSAFDKFEKSAQKNAKPKSMIKVPGTMANMGESEEIETPKANNTKGDAKLNTGVSNSHKNNTDKYESNKTNVVTPAKKISDDFNGEPQIPNNGKMVSTDTEKDSGIALETFNESNDLTNNGTDTIPNNTSNGKSPTNTNEHGNDVANMTINDPITKDDSNKVNHLNMVQNVIKTKSPENNVYNDNDGSTKQESKNPINALDSKQNHKRKGNTNNLHTADKQNITAEEKSGFSEKLTQDKEEFVENDDLVKAFVTDVSIDSETNILEKRMKTKSADRLRVRRSTDSLQRAKSDK